MMNQTEAWMKGKIVWCFFGMVYCDWIFSVIEDWELNKDGGRMMKVYKSSCSVSLIRQFLSTSWLVKLWTCWMWDLANFHNTCWAIMKGWWPKPATIEKNAEVNFTQCTSFTVDHVETEVSSLVPCHGRASVWIQSLVMAHVSSSN